MKKGRFPLLLFSSVVAHCRFSHSVCCSVQGLILLSEFELLIRDGEKEFLGIRKALENMII